MKRSRAVCREFNWCFWFPVEDEDFIAKESGSEVDEEFDSAHETDSGDGASGSDGEGGGEEGEKKVEKEKKKEKKEKKEKSSKDESKPRQKRAKKEPTGPKRAMTSFLYFSKDKRAEVIAKNPGISMGEQGKMLGQMWKEATAEDKEPYEELAQKDKERYEREKKEGVIYVKKSSEKPSKSSEPKKEVASKKAAETFKSTEFVDSDEDMWFVFKGIECGVSEWGWLLIDYTCLTILLIRSEAFVRTISFYHKFT